MIGTIKIKSESSNGEHDWKTREISRNEKGKYYPVNVK